MEYERLLVSTNNNYFTFIDYALFASKRTPGMHKRPASQCSKNAKGDKICAFYEFHFSFGTW